MLIYEKENKLNLTFERTSVPPEQADLVISKEDGITQVIIDGQQASLPQVTEENNGQTSVVQDGVWTLGQASGGGQELVGLLTATSSKITIPEDVKAIERFTILYRNYSEITLEGATTIGAEAFNENFSLISLVINTNSVCILGDSALNYTSIGEGFGWIYVPDNLVDSYKADSSWSGFTDQIIGKSEYPKAITVTETIVDSWEQIFASEEDDTYSTKYSVGDTKILDIDGVYAIMQIVAFDTDILTTGGNAKISWLCKNIPYIFCMNAIDTIVGGWRDSLLRDKLQNTVINSIPNIVKNSIKTVNKTSYDYNASTTVTTSDTLWIPSAYEVAAGVAPIEDSGVVYSGLFTDNASRVKNFGLSSSADIWWLRSSCSYLDFLFRFVDGRGDIDIDCPSSMIGVAFGFCT